MTTIGLLLVLIGSFVVLFSVRIPDPDADAVAPDRDRGDPTTTVPPSSTSSSTTTTRPTTTTSTSTTTTTTLPPNCSRRSIREFTPNGKFINVPGTQKAPKKRDKHIVYTVDIEKGLGLAPGCVGRLVHRILNSEKGWPSRGYSFERGRDGIRVTIATPATVDELCRPLQTNGEYSCWNGTRAMINVERWLHGIPAYRNNLDMYRVYVINHEVGHALGFTHVACPWKGQRAPLMQQQTVSMDGCVPNPWPTKYDAK